MPQENERMNDFFRDHFWGVIVTILLALGGSYFTFRVTMSAFQERVNDQEEHIQEIQGSVDKLQKRRENLRIDLTRVEIKINALLRDRGIDPDEVSVYPTERNQ